MSWHHAVHDAVSKLFVTLIIHQFRCWVKTLEILTATIVAQPKLQQSKMLPILPDFVRESKFPS